jgi:hypothetical protein
MSWAGLVGCGFISFTENSLTAGGYLSPAPRAICNHAKSRIGFQRKDAKKQRREVSDTNFTNRRECEGLQARQMIVQGNTLGLLPDDSQTP